MQLSSSNTLHNPLYYGGLIHANGRIYDPGLGRFLSVDPVFQAPTNGQSMNPYSYVMNNPLSLSDPSGYESACPETQTSCPSGTGSGATANDTLDAMTGSHLRGVNTGASCSGSCANFVVNAMLTTITKAQGAGITVTQNTETGQISGSISTGNGSNALNDNDKPGSSPTDAHSPQLTAKTLKAGETAVFSLSTLNPTSGFTTDDAAALAQYRAYDADYQSTKGTDDEILGGVVSEKVDGELRYFFTTVVRVDQMFKTSGVPQADSSLRGFDLAGWTHTHNYGSAFGGGDAATPAGDNVPYYVRIPSGQALKLTSAVAQRYLQDHPAEGSPGAGRIGRQLHVSVGTPPDIDPRVYNTPNICPGQSACLPPLHGN